MHFLASQVTTIGKDRHKNSTKYEKLQVLSDTCGFN